MLSASPTTISPTSTIPLTTHRTSPQTMVRTLPIGHLDIYFETRELIALFSHFVALRSDHLSSRSL